MAPPSRRSDGSGWWTRSSPGAIGPSPSISRPSPLSSVAEYADSIGRQMPGDLIDADRRGALGIGSAASRRSHGGSVRVARSGWPRSCRTAGRASSTKSRARATDIFHRDWLGRDPTTDPVLATYFLFHDCDFADVAMGVDDRTVVRPYRCIHGGRHARAGDPVDVRRGTARPCVTGGVVSPRSGTPTRRRHRRTRRRPLPACLGGRALGGRAGSARAAISPRQTASQSTTMNEWSSTSPRLGTASRRRTRASTDLRPP